MSAEGVVSDRDQQVYFYNDRDAAYHLGMPIEELRAKVRSGEIPNFNPFKTRTIRISAHWLAKKTGRPELLREKHSMDTITRCATSVVYFIRCCDFIKIGKAVNIEMRMSELQVGNPFPLTLLGTIPGGYDEEKNYHAIFCEARHRGEWFRITPELVDGLRTLGIHVEHEE